MPFTVGDLIDGHYRVEKRYAGGMGYVYIVRDEYVGKWFAIKQLPEFQAENKILAERFRREASAWLLLDYHPNIVQAHSFHPRPEGPILILEYVDGPGLDRLLKSQKKLAPVQAVRYARQFCQGMNYAHTKPILDRGIGVLHRDIKPGNILITRSNQVKVTDFGLAKFEENDAKLTGEGQFVGTIAYSSPEQLRSAGKVTKASDVYSFGAVMYQMLTGQAPFRASTPGELYRLIIQTEPLPISELCPDLDAGLGGIVMRCLEKDSSSRFSDFAELDKAMAGLEFLLKDRRDSSCRACGYSARTPAAQCPVCEGAITAGANAPELPNAGWNCVCGARVSFTERTCAKCGRARTTTAPALTDDDAPLPVSADLVLLSGSDSAAATPLPLKPSDTAFPGVASSSPGDSNIAAAPGDSNVAAAISTQTQSLPKRLWDPALAQPHLLELGPRDKLLGWMLERSHYTVGRDAHMRIRLKDSDVAGYQLFLVRMTSGWLAMNRQPGTRVEFNGWKADQRLLRSGDVARVGSTWLGYVGMATPNLAAPSIPGRWLDRVGPTSLTTRSGGGASTTSSQNSRPSICVLELPRGREVTSRGEPVRLGTSSLCEVRLDDSAAAPVHALVAWQLDGPRLMHIAGPEPVFADGELAVDRRLSHGDSFRIGDSVIHVRLDGDPSVPGRQRAAESLAHPQRMALTIVAGPQKGQTGLFPPGEPAILGRHSDCDFSIPSDPYMSRRHIQLIAQGGTIESKDLGSRHGFAIGQVTHADTATLRVGDVLRVGQSYFLVHYELTE